MDRSDDPCAALVRLRGVHLLPAVLCRRCCGAGTVGKLLPLAAADVAAILESAR